MRKLSLFASISAAFAGLGWFNASEKVQAKVDTGLKKKRRRPTFGGGSVASVPKTTLFRGTGEKETARLAKRAENDLRACRLNYPGWCGYEESGVPGF